MKQKIEIDIDELQDKVNNALAIILWSLQNNWEVGKAERKVLELHEYIMNLDKTKEE